MRAGGSIEGKKERALGDAAHNDSGAVDLAPLITSVFFTLCSWRRPNLTAVSMSDSVVFNGIAF